MVKCIIACLSEFFSNLGWWALAAIAACIALGIGLAIAGGAAGTLTGGAAAAAVAAVAGPIILKCLGFAVGGAALAGVTTCIAACK